MKIILTHKYINSNKRIFCPGTLKIIHKIIPQQPTKTNGKIKQYFCPKETL